MVDIGELSYSDARRISDEIIKFHISHGADFFSGVLSIEIITPVDGRILSRFLEWLRKEGYMFEMSVWDNNIVIEVFDRI